ncbi:universal stress protein [Glutamicibacter sp. NPDC090743]|uniref:universal stress protein n=1 Tax=Glutamicibacter sp. NPDC090743 TaxID=3364001 RepID=UPI0038006587
MSIMVMGVEPGMSPAVLAAAASLARGLDAKLVCIHADSGRFVTDKLAEGNLLASAAPLSEELAWELNSVVTGVELESYTVAGDPAKVLAAVAEQLDAQMIVVGTRRPGIRNKMAQLVEGSIAVALAHKQHRPVLVIPQQPSEENELPWD